MRANILTSNYTPLVPIAEGETMARKTVFVSDFSSTEIADDKESATITIRYGDGRRGVVVADAHIDDKIVAEIAKVGRQQARRGRRPKE
jgi:hydroxymethylglutaryl-CoA reductase